MTKCLLDSCDEEAAPGGKYCGTAHRKKAWNRLHPKRNKGQKGYMKLAEFIKPEPPRVKTGKGYMANILACRNPATHTYRCMSAVVEEQPRLL